MDSPNDTQLLLKRLAELENEKLQLQQQLEPSTEHFLEHICQTFDNLDEGVAILDRQLTFVCHTQAFVRNTRLPELQKGQYLTNTTLHSYFGNVAEISTRFLSDKFPKQLHWSAHLVEWKKWYRITLCRLSTPPNIQSIYILLRITDITHCKEAELERSCLSTELQCQYEHLPIGLAIFDTSCRYLKINKLLADQNGRPAEEHVGKTLHDILPEFLASSLSPMIKQVVETKTPVLDLQVTGIPKDDDAEHTYLCSYSPVFIEDLTEEDSPKEQLQALHRFEMKDSQSRKNTVYGVAMTVVDITHFKNKEKLLMQENTRVQQGNMSKTRFLATVSHELRTPLTCILGMVDCLMEDSELSNEQLDCVQSINRSAGSMLQVLNDILDLSKVEAGKLALEHKNFDLLLEIEMATDVLSFRAAQKNLELVLRFDLSMPRFFVGDPGRIRQILMNVAGNAIKFTEAGYVMIEVLSGDTTNKISVPSSSEFFRTVSTENTNCNKRGPVLIRVTDTGIGIPISQQSEIFEEFKQLETSQTGTGLGLAISRHMARLMQGDVYIVSSLPGVGSVFEISLSLELSNCACHASLGSDNRLSALDQPQSQTHLLKSPGMSPAFASKEIHTLQHGTLGDHNTPEDFESFISQLQERNTKISTLVLCKHERWRNIIKYYLEHFKCFNVECIEECKAAVERLKGPPADLVMSDCNSVEELEGLQKQVPEQTALVCVISPTTRSLITQLVKKFEGTKCRYITRPILPTTLMECLFGRIGNKAYRRTGLLTNRKTQLKRNFSEATTHKTFPNIQVLVVEDNIINQKIILRMLQKLACDTEVAENGKEAVDKWRSKCYDIIFMDCQMPIMNGWDATRAIRTMEKCKGSHTPIVALTARALSTDRTICLESGMDEFLSKPLQQDKVEEILSQFCDMRPPKRRKSTDVQE